MKYSLYNNHLTKSDDYMAIPQDIENISIEDVITQITGPGSILKKTECRAVIYAFLDQLAKNAEEGIGFISPYLIISPGISGVFTDNQDKFDASRHQKLLHINPGVELRKYVENMKLEKVSARLKRPVIIQVSDLKSGVSNDSITPGNVIDIMGKNMKIGDINDKNQGIFLVDTNQKATRLTNIYKNMPKKITVVLPDSLAKGSYELVIKTIYPNCKSLKEGKMEQPLVVK